MVERVIIVGAVAIALAVDLIVLHVVTHQIVKSETVVSGDEVHGAESTARPIDYVARTRNSRCQLGDATSVVSAVASVGYVGQPKSANAVAVAVVPLAETIRKLAGLPAAETHIPGFDNHFRFRKIGVGQDSIEQRMVRVKVIVFVASESGRQVKSESVDLHFVGPVAQRIDNQFDNVRV